MHQADLSSGRLLPPSHLECPDQPEPPIILALLPHGGEGSA